MLFSKASSRFDKAVKAETAGMWLSRRSRLKRYQLEHQQLPNRLE